MMKTIDNILPQTQCGLCTYKGCLPYAEAIVLKGESIDKCLPGGVETLLKIAAITQQDAAPYIASMQEKQKPAMRAVINEASCIGCTKCIQACPVDAIVGAAKQMHTIIENECTGCELCLEPCPVDCIELIILPEPTQTEKQQKADLARQRYYAREQRLQKEQNNKNEKHKELKLQQRRSEITDAIARAKAKKSNVAHVQAKTQESG